MHENIGSWHYQQQNEKLSKTLAPEAEKTYLQAILLHLSY